MVHNHSEEPSQAPTEPSFVTSDSDADDLFNYLSLKQNVELYKKQLDEGLASNRKELKASKNESIAIFGIFASIVTFLSVEVSAFAKIESLAKLIGFSSFLLAVVLFMLVAIDLVTRNPESNAEQSFWSESANKLIALALIFFSFSMAMFFYAAYGYKIFT